MVNQINQIDVILEGIISIGLVVFIMWSAWVIIKHEEL